MELPSKMLGQIAYNTRDKIEEHMLVVMDKSIHEEYSSQPLQTNNKQFKIAVTFPTGYSRNSNINEKKNKKFYFAKSITDKDAPIQITIPPGAYEVESLNNETERIIIQEGQFTEVVYPFTYKPNFSTLGSIIEISGQESLINFTPDDSIQDLLGFDASTIYEEYKLSPNPVDTFSFDNTFLDTTIAQ